MISTNRVAEIAGYLKHEDYSLAVRRMLDAAFDTGNPSLINKTIEWSRRFRQSNKAAGMPEDFLPTAASLMKEMESVEVSFSAPGDTLLLVNEVSKTYTKGNFSLKPISIQINSGEILGVVGENGNGKTTLLRCLSGQLAIDQGAIQYPLLNNPDYYDIKSKVAFIPQRIPRWYGLLKDNLHFSASIAGITGADNLRMVDFMLERLHLTEYAQLNWNQISSGYRTRFEIARILLQKPSLLILDEPLANLDINAQQTILTDLKFMAKSARHPMGIVLSSQQLHEVEKVADRVLFIKDGKGVFNTTAGMGTVSSYALEIETSASREELVALLTEEGIQIQYNGGFYTITSASQPVSAIVGKLVSSRVPLTYFRDITYSTKRYF
jgi:ABC-2 type transport system ATP-binding protein